MLFIYIYSVVPHVFSVDLARGLSTNGLAIVASQVHAFKGSNGFTLAMQVKDSFLLGHVRLLIAKLIFTAIVVIQAVPAFVAGCN